MNKVLEVQQLTKKFKRVVVNGISFEVEKGNVYGLLGPNGSGKSTTLGMLLSTINPTQGNWKWFGNESTSIETLKRIGAIIEQPNFYPYLSADKNLQIVCDIKGLSYSRIDEVLETVGLLERKKDTFKTYSLGMKQRLSIASALLNKPEVMILDEPTNGLDPEGIIQIRELVQNIAKDGTTIIIASHLLDEIEKICSHVIVLKEGNTLYCGSVQGMTNSEGYFELQSKNNAQLMEFLKSTTYFTDCMEKGNLVIAHLRENVEAETINSLLFNKGIVLTHLSKKKESLENQFLELVKK